jgi:hypothetical protein
MMLLIVTLGVWGILITPETRGLSLRTSIDGQPTHIPHESALQLK